MNANEVKLVRVYTREKGGIIFENAFPCNAEFEVVVEAKSGTALFNTGGRYKIQIIVRDLTESTISYRTTLGPGNFGDDNWYDPVLCHTFLIPSQCPKEHSHVCEVIASLTVGIKNPNVSFAKSPMFIIYKS